MTLGVGPIWIHRLCLYISCGLHVFGEDFLKCPHNKYMETIAILGVASLDRRDQIGKV